VSTRDWWLIAGTAGYLVVGWLYTVIWIADRRLGTSAPSLSRPYEQQLFLVVWATWPAWLTFELLAFIGALHWLMIETCIGYAVRRARRREGAK